MRGHGEAGWVRLVAVALLLLVGLSSTQRADAQGGASAPTCDDSWTNAAGGDWSVGADWSTGLPPTSTQAACIVIPLSAPVVTNVAGTAASLTVGGTSGTSELYLINGVTLSGNSSITPYGEVVSSNGGFNMGSATLANDGVIDVTGSFRTIGNVINNADGLVEVTGGNFLVDTGTFTNSGAVFVQPNAVLRAPYGNDPGAVIDNASGVIENQGAIDVYSGATFDQGSGRVVGVPVYLAYPAGGALDLTGTGSGTFFLQSGATLTGDVATGQTVIIAGASSTGSFTNAGTLMGGNGGNQLVLPPGDTLTNHGTIVVPWSSTLSVVGNVVNQATGNITLNSSGFGLSVLAAPATPVPGTLTNDGTITLSPNSVLQTGSYGTIDNDSGTIANAGTVDVNSGGSFIEGAGTITGNPVNVSGSLDVIGTGASSFQSASTTATITGNIAAGQTVRQMGTFTASGSFTNNGTWIGDGGGPLVLPAGGTLTNSGTIEFGHGGGGSGGWVLDGNLINTSTGVMGENGGGFTMGRPGTTFENDGTVYLLFGTGMDFRGQSNCGGSGQPPCDITWNNYGTIYWGTDSDGTQWGSFGLASSFAAAAGDVVSIGGTIVPVPVGEPAAPSTPPSNPTISYGITPTPTDPPGTNTPTWTLSCPAAVADGWSIACPDYTTLYQYYYGTGQTIVPTQVSLAGMGTEGGVNTQYAWGEYYGTPIAITATVSAQDGSTPTGTVDFYGPEQNTQGLQTIGPDLIGTAPLVTNGGITTATLTTDLPPGQYDLMALYPGDSTHLAASTVYGNSRNATTPGGTQYVFPQTPNVALTSSGSPSGVGSPVTFTATVTPTATGEASPTGIVTFFNAGKPFAVANLVTSGGVSSAHLTTADLPVASPNSITAIYSGDYDYSAASTPAALAQAVTAATPVRPQTISFTAPSSGTVNGSDALSPSATSGLPVTLTVDPTTSPNGACTLSADTVSYVHTGTCVLDANQSGDSTFASAPQVSQVITIGPASQTVQFTSTLTSGTVNGPTYTPTASASSGLTPAITLDPTSTGCDLSSGVVSFVASGTCVLDANQAGNSDYLPAPPVQQTFPVDPEAQTITFTAPSSGTVNGSDLLSPSASSGLTVVLTVDASTTPSGACTLSADTVSYVHSGSCVIDANQAGNTAYAPAATVTQTVTIAPASQTVQFTSTPPTSATAGGPTYTPSATASSGLAVAITLDPASSGCSLSGGVVSFTSAGTCVIDANQAGNSDYLPAPQVQQNIVVSVANGSITPAELESLTIFYVQGSARYKALSPSQKVAFTATIEAALSPLRLITPSTPPLVKAAIIAFYDFEVGLLRAGGWLTASQAATLVADANAL